MVIDVKNLIRELQLEPHPEGGHFRRIHDGAVTVSSIELGNERKALSAIHFLLDRGEHARWHRIRQEELWHHAAGGPMVLHLVDPSLLAANRIVIGPPDASHPVLLAVPPGWWQAAAPLADASLCSCVVAPAFDFNDHDFLVDDPAVHIFRDRFPDLAFML